MSRYEGRMTLELVNSCLSVHMESWGSHTHTHTQPQARTGHRQTLIGAVRVSFIFTTFCFLTLSDTTHGDGQHVTNDIDLYKQHV